MHIKRKPTLNGEALAITLATRRSKTMDFARAIVENGNFYCCLFAACCFACSFAEPIKVAAFCTRTELAENMQIRLAVYLEAASATKWAHLRMPAIEKLDEGAQATLSRFQS